MRSLLFSPALLALAMLAEATPARSDEASDARDLFERARTLRAGGDCASAVPLFKKAYEIFPTGLGSLRNWAECEEELSHFSSSRRAWLELKRALLLDRSPKYTGWDHDTEEAAARLAPKVAKLTVHVKGASPSELTVTINDEKIAPALLDTALERDAGHYTIIARGRDGEPVTQSIDLATGESKSIELTVAVAHAPAAVASSTPTPHPAAANPLRTLGWIGVIAGGAALVGAGISLGIRQSALGSLSSACPRYQTEPCPTSVASTVSEGRTASLLVDVLGIGGAVLAVTGVVLVLTSSPHRTTLAFDGHRMLATWELP